MRRLAGAAALALVPAGCFSGVAPPASAPPPRFTEYVALGDSYTAGPLIPVTEADSGCFRSSGNYPSLVAEALHVARFRDVSCVAAETRHVTAPQRTFAGRTVPAQLDAVDTTTDLVTVGIGGNDFGLFGTALVDIARVSRRTVTRIGVRVERVLTRVRERAPRATVVLVGYPRIVEPRTTCADLLPFRASQLRLMVALQRRLDAAMRRAASRSGSVFVDLFATSAGHGVCGEQPWVNGRRTLRGEGMAFHPLASGMRAAADQVLGSLSLRP